MLWNPRGPQGRVESNASYRVKYHGKYKTAKCRLAFIPHPLDWTIFHVIFWSNNLNYFVLSSNHAGNHGSLNSGGIRVANDCTWIFALPAIAWLPSLHNRKFNGPRSTARAVKWINFVVFIQLRIYSVYQVTQIVYTTNSFNQIQQVEQEFRILQL